MKNEKKPDAANKRIKKDSVADESVSRRVFIGRAGKVITMGILAHFELGNKLSASDIAKAQYDKDGNVTESACNTIDLCFWGCQMNCQEACQLACQVHCLACQEGCQLCQNRCQLCMQGLPEE